MAVVGVGTSLSVFGLILPSFWYICILCCYHCWHCISGLLFLCYSYISLI